jgi:hypothetical protein
MTVVLLVVLLGACLFAIVWPLVVHTRVSEHGTPELAEALDDRDRALAALRELEFDHRAGKIDDADYRALVGPLRRAAAEALQALDADVPQE